MKAYLAACFLLLPICACQETGDEEIDSSRPSSLPIAIELPPPIPDSYWVYTKHKQLFLMSDSRQIFYVADVTGYRWADGILVYSAVRGNAGVFAVDPRLEVAEQIDDQKKRNGYYELESGSESSALIYYWYWPSSKTVNVRKLKKRPKNRHAVGLPSAMQNAGG